MLVKDGFIVRQIVDQFMAVPIGKRTQEVHGTIALTETGAFLWKKLESDSSVDDLVNALINEYDVERDHAYRSVTTFLNKMKLYNLLERE